MSAEGEGVSSALLGLTGCYTTARVRAGGAFYALRHASRLQRDARALGLDPPAETSVLAAFSELAEAVFGPGDGIVRLDLGRSRNGRCHLVGRSRSLGEDPPVWRAVTAPFVHAGPGDAPGAKRSPVALYDRARRCASDAGVDEALLFDARHCLVEGARSNLFVVDRSGRLIAPGPSRGAVAGLAREILCERLGTVADADLGPVELRGARELVAVNAVRGARPIVGIDEALLGTGAPGPWAARLDEILDEEASRPSRPRVAL